MKKTISLALVLARLTSGGLALGLASVCPAAEHTWRQKADIPTARGYHSTSVVDGKIYAIGGATSEPNPVMVWPVEVYDPITDSWTQKADIPTPRGLLSTSVVDGKIYAIGGALAYGGTGVSTVEEYDPATDTWMSKADMPTPRWGVSTSVVNGKIYAIGGRLKTGTAPFSTVEEYDPTTDTWTRKTDMPAPRWGLSAGVVDGKIYAIGGGSPASGGSTVADRTVEVYDPAMDTWERKADMPTARRNFSTSVVAGRIYAIGGWDRSDHYPYPTVEQYDPVTDKWTTKPDMRAPRAVFSTSVVDGKIYAIGGLITPHPCIATSTVYELTISGPPPDFNGDEIVDIDDLLILIEHWGTDESLCDIGPTPWGDGIVDVQDLEVLMSYWQQEFLPVSLLAYWKLDETEGDIAYDSLGGKEGILNGNPLWQPTGGQVDGALAFDGTDDYVRTDPVLNPADGPFSVFAWVNGGAPGQAIISQTDNPVYPGGVNWLLADQLEGKLMTGLVRPPGGRDAPQPPISEFIITDGQWHRVGFVWDGAQRMLYVDDVEVATDTQVQAGLASAYGGLHIGAGKKLETGSFFSGLIDDVRIYDRAITP